MQPLAVFTRQSSNSAFAQISQNIAPLPVSLAVHFFVIVSLAVVTGCGVREEPSASDETPVFTQFDAFLNAPSSQSDGVSGNDRPARNDSLGTSDDGSPDSDDNAETPVNPGPNTSNPDNPNLDNPGLDNPGLGNLGQNTEGTANEPGNIGTESPTDNIEAGSFAIAAIPVIALQEGDAEGQTIAININRGAEHFQNVRFTLSSDDTSSLRGLSIDFQPDQISSSESSTTLNLRLDIGLLPIVPTTRTLNITAQDGLQELSTALIVEITPVARPDIYLLAGGSNMLGQTQPGSLQAASGQADAPDARILQLAVSNSENADITGALVLARDPLHEALTALNPTDASVGLALSFAKRALPNTTQNIILVPTALANSGFCEGQASGWQPSPALGNAQLFERAIDRVRQTINLSGGILRGILWHQGEADANQRCANQYGLNLARMIQELRTQLPVDARGESARGPQASIPLVVGTLSRGADERGDFSIPDSAAVLIDNIVRNIDLGAPFSAAVLLDDLVPLNGYPCGLVNCRNFGAEALREAGIRYFEGLTIAATR